MVLSKRSQAGASRVILALMVATLAAAPALAGKKDDKRAAAQLKLAQSLFQAGRFREALGTADELVREEPRSVPAHLLRGMILYGMDEQEAALVEFDRTLDLDSRHTDARIYKGSALANLKRHDQAMAEYRKALADLTYPQPERIHVNIGMLHRELGRNDLALESLKKAVSLNGSYARAYYELGITYDALDRKPEALRAYQDALVGMDDVADLHLRLGRALLAAGNPVKAREHFERVTKLAPNGPEAAQARDQIARIQPPS